MSAAAPTAGERARGAIGPAGASLRLVVYSLPLLFLALFFLYPLAAILRLSFAGSAGGAGLGALVADSYYVQVIWFSAWQAGLSTLLTLALGLPAAYVFARYEFPGKSLLRAVATIPFVMPTVVVAAAFIAFTVNQHRAFPIIKSKQRDLCKTCFSDRFIGARNKRAG